MIAGFQEVGLCVGRIAEGCRGRCGLPGGKKNMSLLVVIIC